MNRLYFLMGEFGTNDVPLQTVARKYFGHDDDTIKRWARHKKYPFPVFRAGGQKSDWFVSIQALSNYLDQRENEAAA